jgi:hypothetical protein
MDGMDASATTRLGDGVVVAREATHHDTRQAPVQRRGTSRDLEERQAELFAIIVLISIGFSLLVFSF